MRQCISCRTQLSRDSFIRITKNKDTNQETVVINPDKHQFGRSVYICKTKECITKAIKEKKIVKILKISTKNVEPLIPELEKLTQHSVEGVLI